MKEIKILHVAQSEGAGVTEYIKMLAGHIEWDMYEHSIVGSRYYEKERAYFEQKGWRVYTVDMVRDIKMIDDIKAIVQLRKLFKKVDSDIIHIHSSKAGVLARIAAIGLKSKVIYNAHGWAFNMRINKKKMKLYRYIERFLSYFTDKIINISDSEYESALKCGIVSKKMLVIKNAINTENEEIIYDKEKIFKELNIPLKSYIIGICGRITDQKSPEIFMEVCSKVLSIIPDAYFLMIGDGELKEKILEQSKAKGIDKNLIITGWTNESDKYISILDIALLTSKWEGFGLVLLQYMLQKKPVIAANIGGIPEIIMDGITGITVPWDDIEAYVQNILSIRQYPEDYQKMIENAYQSVKREYSLYKLGELHKELYIELVSRDSRHLYNRGQAEYNNSMNMEE